MRASVHGDQRRRRSGPGRRIFPARARRSVHPYPREDLGVGESYEVLSSVSVADETSLREVGDLSHLGDAPLPATANRCPTACTACWRPSDRGPGQRTTAKAIESYLRQIPYSLDIPGPRLGQDGVDYFLFDEQQGYCDYYASAMVVMLRSVGVPARYVRGYIHTSSDDGVYQLLESDGHAWPEVYFPGYGWVEFEPTGGRPALVRRATQDPARP